MAMKVELIDELLKASKSSEDIFGDNGLVKQFVKALSERALQAELATHLGYEKHDSKGRNSSNSRNGSSTKVVKGAFGEAEIAIPRDRSGTFEPQLIQKGQTRFDGFDDKILAMLPVVYRRGISKPNCKNYTELRFLLTLRWALI
jgi:transposase-like protein